MKAYVWIKTLPITVFYLDGLIMVSVKITLDYLFDNFSHESFEIVTKILLK